MYKLFLEIDPDVIELCNLFCEAKGFFWNLFFGWRKTNRHGAYFKFTEKQHKKIIESAKVLFDYSEIGW